MSITSTPGFRLSPEQARLWPLIASGRVLNSQILLKLADFVDEKSLKTSLNTLVERFEILRTVFPSSKERKLPLQVVIDFRTYLVRELKLGQHETVENVAHDELNKGFDHESKSLFRSTLITSNESRFLLITASSMILDAGSLATLADSLNDLLSGKSLEEEILQYPQIAVWQHDLINEAEEEISEFWKNYEPDFQGNPSLTFMKSRNNKIRNLSVLTPVGDKTEQTRELNAFALDGDTTENSRKLSMTTPDTVNTEQSHKLSTIALGAKTSVQSRKLGTKCFDGDTTAQSRKLSAITLDANISAQIRKQASNHDTDLATLAAVIVSDFLSRYTASDQLHVSIIDPVRGFDELRNVVGNLSQSIPWTFQKASSNSAFKHSLQLLQSIREHSLYFNSDRVATDKTAAATSDIEVHLSTNSSLSSHFETVHIVSGRGCKGLQISVLDRGNDVIVQLMADVHEVSSEWIEELTAQMPTFFAHFLSHIGKPEQHGSWLDESHQSIVAKLSDVKLAQTEVPLLSDLLTEVFTNASNQMALMQGMKWMNFKQLQAASENVARQLLARGIQPGSHVGVLLPRSIDAIVSILGILRAGACYVPIDVEYPESRISYMIKDAGLSLLITSDSRYQDAVPCATPSDLNTDSDNPDIKLPGAEADSPAYIIYTSGSTGNPKGCIITHRQLSWYLDWARKQYFEGISGSSVPLFTSLAFDLTVTTIFGSLISGNCLTIFDESMPLNEVVASIFDPSGSTEVLKMTPAHTLLLPHSGLKITKVKRVIVGGEALLPVHVEQLLNLNPKMEIFNEYGPTETVVGCSVDVITSKDQPITIGKPVDHASMYIVDQNLRILPVGVPGELVIGGHSVSNGYLNRADLNQSKFVELAINGERVYRSGDLAYLLPDGNFTFLGRTDNQVKIRGYRIELDEIRTQIQRTKGVKDAFVSTTTYNDDSQHLIAYVVSNDISDEQDIKNSLSEVLPAYMIPSFVLFVPEILLTVNGKVDSKALPDVHSYIQQHSRVVRDPENELQQELKAIWMEVLALDNISIDDNFFEVGGHSLKAMQIVSRVQHSLKLNLLLSDFFDHLTIEQLDMHLKLKNKSEETLFPKCTEASSYPCSGPQKRLWILDKLPGAGNAYHVSGIYNLKGILNPDLFNDAISQMIMRHEVLRTSFIKVNDHPEQVIHNNSLPMVEYVDATHHSEPWINEATQATLYTPFDLSDPSLFRSVLIKTAPDSFRWVVCMHHIISDGWSVDIMLEEIQVLYRHLANNSASKLAPLPIQYKEFASWMDDEQQTPEYAELEKYWLDLFRDPIEPTSFPFQKPRPALKSYHGSSITTSIPDATFGRVKSLHKQGFSSFITLTTALSLAFKSILGRKEFVIGTPVAGRFMPQLESLIGFFVNVVPLKIDLAGHETPKESLQAMRRLIMSALEHQQVSFDKWTTKVNHINDPSRSPIFDVLVVYHNNPTSNWHLDQVTLTVQDFEEKYSKYDLVVEFTEHESGLELLVNYNTDLFESGDIESFARYLSQILHTITAHPDAAFKNLLAPPTSTVVPKVTSAQKAFNPTPATDDEQVAVNPTQVGVAKTVVNSTLTTDVAKADDLLLKHLHDIWANVLGRTDISETDNFFSLGGDSIKAIQISSALYQHGYKLTIAALFSFPTIRELHSRIELVSQQTAQEPISGTHLLTPIQSWLFSRDAKTLNRFYQSALVKLDHPHPLLIIKAAWKKVMIHHDELRARPIYANDTVAMEIGKSVPQFRFDHRYFGDDDVVQQEIVSWLDSWIRDTNVFNDSLCSVLVLTQKSTSNRYVFIAVHHLLVDIVSWRPILEDFNSALDGLMNTSEVTLPLKTTSFQDWAGFVEKTRNSVAMDSVRRFWNDQKPELERGKIHQADVVNAQTRFTLELPEINESLGNTTRVFQAKMNDVLTTAMSRALLELGHGEQVNVSQEVHGRDSMPNESVGRTVGWFTNEYPVPIRYHADAARHLREVKEARVRFEEHGRWFMISESAEFVSGIQKSSVGINYVGDVTASDQLKRISVVSDTTIINQSLEDGLNLGKLITVFGFTQNDKLTLTIESHIESLPAEKIANTLSRMLSELGSLSHQTEQNVNTPSDFDYDGLDIDSLDDLLKSIK